MKRKRAGCEEEKEKRKVQSPGLPSPGEEGGCREEKH